MDDAAICAALVRQFEDGRDLDETHELYHEDAILEFPQSGERFVGLASFLTWRKQYPAKRRLPDPPDHRRGRALGHRAPGLVQRVATDVRRQHHPVPRRRIARESIYVAEPFPPSEVRRDWSTPFDPLASVSLSDWQPGVPFGIEG